MYVLLPITGSLSIFPYIHNIMILNSPEVTGVTAWRTRWTFICLTFTTNITHMYTFQKRPQKCSKIEKKQHPAPNYFYRHSFFDAEGDGRLYMRICSNNQIDIYNSCLKSGRKTLYLINSSLLRRHTSVAFVIPPKRIQLFHLCFFLNTHSPFTIQLKSHYSL